MAPSVTRPEGSGLWRRSRGRKRREISRGVRFVEGGGGVATSLRSLALPHREREINEPVVVLGQAPKSKSSGPKTDWLTGWLGSSGCPGLPTTINLTEGSNVVQQKTVPAVGEGRW
jgi:hypothetical protein